MIRDLENVWIPMADGCRLAARIWMPEGAEAAPVPAILEYLPYRKRDFTRRRDETMHPWFAARGYAGVRVDMRGSGDSDGILHDEYLAQEQDDALEVIAWIARQPWCSGRVGMMGKSWGAYNSLQVAARRPPALAAIVAVMGTDDRFAECIHYSGGALLNDNFWWGCIMQLFNARPPDPQIVGERWREMWRERLEAEQFWPEIWLRHQRLDDYWKHASVCFDYDAIQCPVWFWGGWADLYRDTPFRLAQHLAVPHKVTVGPWAHLYPHEAEPKPAVGFLQESLRWWDRWLKGKDNGIERERALRLYMMESVPPVPHLTERAGRWIEEEAWPSPHVATRQLVLGPGRLETDPGTVELAALEVASPQSTGLAAGDWASFAVAGDLPGDQSLDAFGSLEFDSEPLTERLELLGHARATLELAVDRPSAVVTARLIDVAPGGRATLVARGFLNLAQRESRENPTAVVPGEPYRISVQMTGTAYAFPPGHRVRLALSTAYWLRQHRDVRHRGGPAQARRSCRQPLANQFFQLGYDLEQVADQTDVGNLEDRRLRILVDGDDGAGILDARQVLDRARDSDGDVELGGDDLAGLAYLQLVGGVARIHGGPRGAHCRVQLVGESVQRLLEGLGAAQSASARDHSRGGLQVRPVALGRRDRHEAGMGRYLRIDGGFLDGCRAARRGRLERGRAYGPDDLGAGLDLHGDYGVGRVDRPAEARCALDRHDVADLRAVEEGRDPRHHVLAESRRGTQHVSERAGQRGNLWRDDCGERMRVGGILDRQYTGDALQRRGLRGHCAGIRRTYRDGDLSVGDGCGTGDALGRAGIEVRAIMLGDNQNTVAHYRTPLLLSVATSSAASFTLMPFCRCGGGSKRASFRRCRCSMPSAASVRVSSGFFLAFMISGSLT